MLAAAGAVAVGVTENVGKWYMYTGQKQNILLYKNIFLTDIWLEYI